MKNNNSNQVKVEKSRYTGVQKCTSGKRTYYRGRVKFLNHDYYTEPCDTATEAKDKREDLIAELKERKAMNLPIEVITLKADFLVKDVLQQYRDVMTMLKPGKTYSLSTISERRRLMKQMIEDDYYCIIRDVPVRDLTNASLLNLKNNYYKLRNREGNRYDIDTIRAYLNSFRAAFVDCANKNEAVAKKVADLNWDNLKANKKEQNSPTQLIILENEEKADGNKIKVGETVIRLPGKNKKTVKRVRKNEDDHWTNEDYNHFINDVYFKLFDEYAQIYNNGEKRYMEFKGSDYEQATIYAIMYETGMRFGEIRALDVRNFYTQDGALFYRLEHAIPQRLRGYPDEYEKDEEIWNTICLPKNRNQRPVLISPNLETFINCYLTLRVHLMNPRSEHFKSNFIFPDLKVSSFDKRHPKFFKKYNLKQIRIHDFRHSTAYNAKFENNIDSKTVAKILGHKDEGKLIDKIYAPSKYKENQDALLKLYKDEQKQKRKKKVRAKK